MEVRFHATMPRLKRKFPSFSAERPLLATVKTAQSYDTVLRGQKSDRGRGKNDIKILSSRALLDVLLP